MKTLVKSAAQLRIVRFLTVGLGAAALLFVLSYLFRRLGMPPFAGSVAAYAIAFVIAYSAQRGWTFGGAHSHRHAFPRYLAVQVICALVAGLVAHGAVAGLGWSALAMSAALTLAAGAASFVLSSLWVFPSRQAAD